MIFNFMKNHAYEFIIEKMAKVFNVSRSGYYKFLAKKKSLRKTENEQLLEKITLIHKKNREVYGSPRIHAVLKKLGEHYSRKRIASLMKKNNIQAKMRKKWKGATGGSKDLTKIAPNLLNQNFTTTTANAVWVSDITYIRTQEGWLYLAGVLDLFSRKVVGFGTSSCINTNLIIRALEQAICHRIPNTGLIYHSDRGTQYTSAEFKLFTAKYDITLSMSAKGNCYDNAAMESFFHTLKTEHAAFCDFKTRKEATQSIFEYIEIFYNRQRIHSTLNYLSPLQFEQQAQQFFSQPKNRVG